MPHGRERARGGRPEEVAHFLARHPDTQVVDAVFADLCGVVRGKRYPVRSLDKLYREGLALPGSSFLLDAVGENHDPLGCGFSDGDPDHLARPLPGSLKPVPWAARPAAQLLLDFHEPAGAGPSAAAPYRFSPRNVLAGVLARFAELGLTPVVAFELEFYLIDRRRAPGGAPRPPLSPATGRREHATQVYGMADVDAFEAVLEDIPAACAAQDIPTGAISAEYAPGQFEINLEHEVDALAAADHCVMFQRAVRGVARRHGLQATFMAKPYPQETGSGMHLHVSLVDRGGVNVLDGDRAGPASAVLRHAVAGILEGLPEAMAFLAPNPNSYRRFTPNAFVPIRRTWGFENRSVALRVPLGAAAARRIEHRVAGADANPYLALATALAGMHCGIIHEWEPEPPFEGNAGDRYDAALPWRPRRAFEALAEARHLPAYFGADYVAAYAACKLAEMDKFEAEIQPIEYRWYLQTQ